MNVTRPNTVALNILSGDDLAELILRLDAESRVLRQEYVAALAAVNAARTAMDDHTRLRMIVGQHHTSRQVA